MINSNLREKKKKRVTEIHNRLMDSRVNALIVAKDAPKEENRQGKMKGDKERVSEALLHR